jgi:transposase-like protein
MPGGTPSYPPDFKREAVRLVRSSPNRSVAQIAKELGVSDNPLRNWVKHTEIDQGEREGLVLHSSNTVHKDAPPMCRRLPVEPPLAAEDEVGGDEHRY